ncbi:3'-5' exonuclease [Deinococcus ruber]|uniref:DNA polymerase III subunit epsilon n=1 Tax=Deinococcus ruber TaxID=1848197 RepID=A0A918CM16_9DEIO|nr:3'-5' exonuclease [Deinococcus ruber]GGR31281.1 DNA polymerase III subunit epsilon [Deinococcus ruber]
MSVMDPFRRWAALPNLAVLDTETTGLHGEVIELAIVDGSGAVLFDERIRPTCPIEPGAQAIHGITDADLADLPGIAHHWPRLRSILAERHVLIYNRDFDVYRLLHSLHMGVPHWDPQAEHTQGFGHFHRTSECVMRAYAASKGYRRWVKLVTACRDERIETADLDAAHSALGDALRTLRLIQAVAGKDGPARLVFPTTN